MASTRNNRIQERRAALREQQKQEREAADAAFKALDDEHMARVGAAQAVASVVELSGRERAAILLDLEPRDVTAYVNFAKEVASEEAAADTPDGDGGEAATSATDSGEPTAAGIPAQGEPADAAAAASA